MTGVEMQQIYTQSHTQTCTYIQMHKLLENVERDGGELSGFVMQRDMLLLASSKQANLNT